MLLGEPAIFVVKAVINVLSYLTDETGFLRGAVSIGYVLTIRRVPFFEHCMGSVVALQHDCMRGRRGGREGGASVFITVKRFDNKAQGRREGGAPWVQRQKVRGTPTGSDNMDGHILQTMSRMSRAHPVRRMFNPVGQRCEAFFPVKVGVSFILKI